jgi:hypothetical protein
MRIRHQKLLDASDDSEHDQTQSKQKNAHTRGDTPDHTPFSLAPADDLGDLGIAPIRCVFSYTHP